MVEIFLIVWFYIYAGLLFQMTGLFSEHNALSRVICWPILVTVWFINRVTIKTTKNPRK